MKNPFVALDEFFFKPISVSAISLYRIVFALLVCQLNFVHLAPDLLHWYGKHGVVSIESLRAYFYFQEPRLDLLLLFPGEDFYLLLFFGIYCLAGVSLLFGFHSRICSIIVFAGICTLHHHNPYNINSGDGFMRLAAFFLMFTPCGGAYSIDRLIKSLRQDWRETGFAPDKALPWAQRLIQIQLSLLYTQATYVKSLGLDWQNGDAVYFASRHDDLMRVPLPILFDNPFVWKFLTWSTLVIEFALGVLIWIKPLRYWLIALGVSLHLGIDLSMNIPMFEWLMITAYVLFIEPEDLERAMSAVRSRIVGASEPQAKLLYDSRELSWVRVSGVVRRLDVFDRVELCDIGERKVRDAFKPLLSNKQLQKMTIITSEEQLQGFEAFKWLCLKLPLLHFLLPMVYIPVLALTSRLIFDSIWRSREKVFGAPPIVSRASAYERAAAPALTFVAVCGLIILNVQISRRPISEFNMYDSIVKAREEFARKELGKTLELDKVAANLPGDAFLDPFSSLEKNKKVLTTDDINKLNAGQNKSTDADTILKVLEEHDAAAPPSRFPEERLKEMSRLADVYWQSNRLSDAEKLLKYVWQARSAEVKKTGVGDPELLATMLATGDLYRDWGWYDKSIACYKQAIQYMHTFTPASTAQIMASRANLAVIYYLAGQSTPDPVPRAEYYGEARKIYNDVLPFYARKYGDRSSRYKNVRMNEALLRRDGG